MAITAPTSQPTPQISCTISTDPPDPSSAHTEVAASHAPAYAARPDHPNHARAKAAANSTMTTHPIKPIGGMERYATAPTVAVTIPPTTRTTYPRTTFMRPRICGWPDFVALCDELDLTATGTYESIRFAREVARARVIWSRTTL